MMAATAVGVSHLVQSTRAGAGYGLTLIFVIIAIVLLKYPAFRFAVEYASVTGRSLIHAYVRLGRPALFWLMTTMLIEVFVGTSVLSLVTAGVLVNVFDLPLSSSVAAILVALLTAGILMNGRYQRAEGLVRILVIAFSLVTLLVTAIAIPQLGSEGRAIVEPLSADRPTLTFIIAMTGYMPLPLAVAIFQSIWVRERRSISDYPLRQAVFDLNVGWWLAALLAICFVVIGAAVLYQTEVSMPASAPGFAGLLFSLFTRLTGEWIYPLLAAGGIAVIWSTLVAVMDAVPRILDRLWHELRGDDDSARNYYRHFLALQVVGGSLVLIFLLDDFATFIDISASLSFLIAPAIAWYNYRAISSPEIGDAFTTSPALVAWNRVSIAMFVLFAIAFAALRLT
jgi:Mn2+/Fe2+ NRAMP family transporter